MGTDTGVTGAASDTLRVLHSAQDASVNFIRTYEGLPGYAEARYVRRSPEYFIAYLSSQTGCQQACRMCHLTITKQTKLADVSLAAITEQARDVLQHYAQLPANEQTASVVHFSFMARGEPFASARFHNSGEMIVDSLACMATARNLMPRVMISTIMPTEMGDKSLVRMFPRAFPNIYYSIYSTNETFRKKWLPRALPVSDALSKLKDYQDHTNKIIRLHWAFIKGENDSLEDVRRICDAVDAARLRVDVNVVRYNPYSSDYGSEPDPETIYQLTQELHENLPALTKIKVVPRVGQDVYASCGMFAVADAGGQTCASTPTK